MPERLVAAITAAAQGAAPLVAAPASVAPAIGCVTSTKPGMRAPARVRRTGRTSAPPR
ncbi:hypothetical protein WEI85_15685 [Actinomycetes bacterium KLBMP 9797]